MFNPQSSLFFQHLEHQLYSYSPNISVLHHHHHQQIDLPTSWETTYRNDLSTHASTPSHTGTNWFDDALASDKVIDYLNKTSTLNQRETSFLDLGTGNGGMLFALRDEGWTGPMIGVDYSSASIELAKRIGEARSSEREEIHDEEQDEENRCFRPVQFEKWDIMKEDPGDWVPCERFDVVMDKGTFDAISLNDEVDDQGRRICEGYAARVEPLVKNGGLVIATSCNWTEEELIRWFQTGRLKFRGRVKYPTFKFGGQEGQSVVSVCFKKATDAS